MCMKIQGRLMQVHFIEIQQVFEKKKFGYFYNRLCIYMGYNACSLLKAKSLGLSVMWQFLTQNNSEIQTNICL